MGEDLENPLLVGGGDEEKTDGKGSRGVDLGLTSAEVSARLAEFGRNEVPIEKVPQWMVFVRQFYGTMPMMLLLACGLAGAVKDWQDLGIIAILILVNACIGFYEESKAMASIEALRSKLHQHVSALRDGEVTAVDVAELVPGDVVALRGGQAVPADGHWLDGDAVKVDTSALTGEPVPWTIPRGGKELLARAREKIEDSKEEPETRTALTADDRTRMLAGCVLVQGECRFVVAQTGPRTEIGQAATMVADAKKGPKVVGRFEAQIMVIVKLIILASLAATLVVLIYQIRKRDETFSHVLLVCLSLVIGAVPIALPLVLQVTLALGAREMADHGAIVTHTTALQEIASMTVLNSDKTGTLTTAKMAVIPDMIWLARDQGDDDDEKDDDEKDDADVPYTQEDCLAMAALASNASNLDDPVDVAILNAARSRFGAQTDAILAAYGVKVHFDGFNPDVKRAVGVYAGGKKTKVAKGLLDKILDTGDDSGAEQWVCAGVDRNSRASDEALAQRASSEHSETCHSITADVSPADLVTASVKRLGGGVRARALAADAVLSAAGYKTLAVAVSVNEAPMKLVGLVPMLDPPRGDTSATLECLGRAGIAVKMITGDHLNIAKETARLIGLGDRILPQTSLWPASAVRDELIVEADGFAQTMPRDKREVVVVLQNKGLVVGMTGDGVNDAAALAQAQVGIAVEGATDAAVNAADIVLTQPGLSAIYAAVYESRLIFRRLRAYVLYRVAATIQIVLVLCCLIFGWNDELKPLYVVLLALLNDVTMTPIAHDHVEPSPDPELPETSSLVLGAGFLGFIQTLFSLGFYQCGHAVTGIAGFHRNDHQAIRQAAVYVQISLSVELMIFACRAPKPFFLTKAPSFALFSSVTAGNLIVCAMAKFGILVSKNLSWRALAGIVVFDLAAFVALDIVKCLALWAVDGLEASDRALAEPDEIAKLVAARRPADARRPGVDVRRSSLLDHRFSERLSILSRRSSAAYHTHHHHHHHQRPSTVSASSIRTSLRPNVPANLAAVLAPGCPDFA